MLSAAGNRILRSLDLGSCTAEDVGILAAHVLSEAQVNRETLEPFFSRLSDDELSELSLQLKQAIEERGL